MRALRAAKSYGSDPQPSFDVTGASNEEVLSLDFGKAAITAAT